MKIKKDDRVKVIAGKDKGKIGIIKKADPEKNRVIVEGVSVVKRHFKPKQKGQQGEIIEREAFIDVSNVMLCDENGKTFRIKKERKEDGTVVRVNKTTGKPV